MSMDPGKYQNGRTPEEEGAVNPPWTPPPPQTKVTIVGKNDVCHWEHLVGPFLVRGGDFGRGQFCGENFGFQIGAGIFPAKFFARLGPVIWALLAMREIV